MAGDALKIARSFSGGALALERHSFALGLALVLLFNLYWYGAFLSFPLFGEDAAALYSSLLEAMKDGHLVTTLYPIKWLEGLGQPNLFVTFSFDPFAWVMALPIDPADSFRLSMALRATAAWMSSYWFVIVLFRGRRELALFSATLYLLINFILMNAWGIHTFAGMYNATHAALFPLLPAYALLIMRSRRRLGLADLGLFMTLLFFLLDYPVGSLMGTAVFLVYAFIAVVLARPAERARAKWGLVKIAAMVAILLLAPPLSLLSSWSALAENAARTVFSHELFAYGYDYVPPVMWARTSWALRLCIVVCLSVLLFSRRWPRPLRMAAATLFVVVAGVQLVAFIKYMALFPALIDRLPRFQFFEFYITPCYAACGGFALVHWRELLQPRLRSGRDLLLWAAAATALVLLSFVILPLGAAILAVYAVLVLVVAWRRGPLALGGPHLGPSRRLVARAALLALLVLAIAAWLPPTAEIYPIFYKQARCATGVFWCRDAVGPTVGAGDNPITQFLRRALAEDGRFAGRAETLIRPPVRFARVPAREIKWTSALFERLHGWYARAYQAQSIKYSPVDNPFWRPPQRIGWESRDFLLFALDSLANNGEPYYGPYQEDLILEMHKWYGEHGREFDLLPMDFGNPWDHVISVQAMVDERTAAFFATGNGLLLRALPLQNVPVASSYEQSLGYLYYLLWTRYVSAGVPAHKSINMTTLEALHPERLALLGVRYLVARDSNVYERPPLERVMGWHGYSVYAVRGPNLAGYAVRDLEFGDTLTAELKLMRRHGFHPDQTAVLPAGARAAFADAARRPRGTLASSSIELAPRRAGVLGE